MAYFAKLDENNVVIDTIVAEQSFIDALDDGYKYIEYSKTDSGKENMGGIGNTWDEENQGFIPQSPFASWNWNVESWAWEAPTPMPEASSEEEFYRWNEDDQSWDLVTNLGS
jgi:hypothetical protein